jgi:hypothetical protein
MVCGRSRPRPYDPAALMTTAKMKIKISTIGRAMIGEREHFRTRLQEPQLAARIVMTGPL